MLLQFQILTSFKDQVKEIFDSPLALLLLIVCVILFAAIVCIIALLSVRYKVTYVVDGSEKEEKSFYRHSVIDQRAPAAREGYVFGGWFSDEACTERVPDTLRANRKGIVLYARWEKIKQDSERAETKESESPIPEQLASEQVDVSERVEKDIAVEAVEESVEENIEENAEQIPEENTEESAEKIPEEGGDSAESSEGDEFDNAVVTTVTGTKVFVQYRRSFEARLIQADDEIKAMYNAVRNAVLTTDGVKERVSWNYISFNKGRKQFAKINANRKSLILYLALDPANIDEKYNIRDVSAKKRYKEVPVRYKITGSRSLCYALELIEKAAEYNDFSKKDYPFEQNLSFPFETREQLIRRGLIKVFAKKDSGETITEEQLEEFIEEGATVESLSSFTVTDQISVAEAEKLVSDATAKQLIALAEEVTDDSPRVAQAKRAFINLDTISANFSEGDTVDLEALKAKKLIDSKKSAVKILARGSLDKALIIEAADFSLPAVKMIVITGGRVVKLKKV